MTPIFNLDKLNSRNNRKALVPAGIVLGLVSLGCPGTNHQGALPGTQPGPGAAASNPILAAADVAAGTRQVAYFDRRGDIEWSIEGGTFLGDTQSPSSPVVLFSANPDAKVFQLRVRVLPEKPARHATDVLVAKAARAEGAEAPTYSFQGNVRPEDDHAPKLEALEFFSAMKDGCTVHVANPLDGYRYDWSIRHGFNAAPRPLGTGRKVAFNSGKGPVALLSVTATNQATGATSSASIGCGVVSAPQAPAIKVAEPVAVGFRQHAFIRELHPGEEYQWELDPAEGSFTGGAATATGPVVGYTVARPGPFTLHCLAVNKAGDTSARTSLTHTAAGPFVLEPPKLEIPAHLHEDTGPYRAKVVEPRSGLVYEWAAVQGAVLETKDGPEVSFRTGKARVLGLSCTAKDPATGATSSAQAVAKLLRVPRKPQLVAPKSMPRGTEQAVWVDGGGLPGESYQWEAIENGTIQPGADHTRGAVATFKADKTGTFILRCVAVNAAQQKSEAGSCTVEVTEPVTKPASDPGDKPAGEKPAGDKPMTEDKATGNTVTTEDRSTETDPPGDKKDTKRNADGSLPALKLNTEPWVSKRTGRHVASVVDPVDGVDYTWEIKDGTLKENKGPAVTYMAGSRDRLFITCRRTDPATGETVEATERVAVLDQNAGAGFEISLPDLVALKVDGSPSEPAVRLSREGRKAEVLYAPEGTTFDWAVEGTAKLNGAVSGVASVEYQTTRHGTFTLSCTATLPDGSKAEDKLEVKVVPPAEVPVLEVPPKVFLGDTKKAVKVTGGDTSGLSYLWRVVGDALPFDPLSSSGASSWAIEPPVKEGDFTIYCKSVNDLGEESAETEHKGSVGVRPGRITGVKATAFVSDTGPDLAPVFDPGTLAPVFQDVTLSWTLDGAPEELFLTDSWLPNPKKFGPADAAFKHSAFRVDKVRRRRAFTLTASVMDPALGEKVQNTFDTPVIVGRPGISVLAGETEKIGRAYLERPAKNATPWRNVAGLACKDGKVTFTEGPDHTLRTAVLDRGKVTGVEPAAGMRGMPDSGSGMANLSSLGRPESLAFHRNLNAWLVVESARHCVKLVPAGGPDLAKDHISVFKGMPRKAGQDAASFKFPSFVAVHQNSGLVFIVDKGNKRIQVFDQMGVLVRTFLDPKGPNGIAVDQGTGELYVSNSFDHTIYLIKPQGPVGPACGWDKEVLFAGVRGKAGHQDGILLTALFNDPTGLAIGEHNGGRMLYIADTGNHMVRAITLDPPAGHAAQAMTLAGALKPNENKVLPEHPDLLPDPGDADGDSAIARLRSPRALAAGGAGEVFVQDQDGLSIRGLSLGPTLPNDCKVSTLGGRHADQSAGKLFGTGRAAKFDGPAGLAAGKDGTLFVADSRNHVIKTVDPMGRSAIYAGKLGQHKGEAGDGGTRLGAYINQPSMVGVDFAGRVYVLEPQAKRVRLLLPKATDPTEVLATDSNAAPVMLAVSPYTGWDPEAKAPTPEKFMFVAYQLGGNEKSIRMHGFLKPEEVCPKIEALAMAVDPRFDLWVLSPSVDPGDPRAKGDPRQLVLNSFARSMEQRKWVPGPTRVLDFAPLGLGIPDIRGMAFDSRGNLFLGDAGNGVVLRLSVAGALEVVGGNYPWLGPLAEESPAAAYLNTIQGLAVTPLDDVVVTCGNAVVQLTLPPPAPGVAGWVAPDKPAAISVKPFPAAAADEGGGADDEGEAAEDKSTPAAPPATFDPSTLSMADARALNKIKVEVTKVPTTGGDAAAIQGCIKDFREKYLADPRMEQDKGRKNQAEFQVKALEKMLEARAALAAGQVPEARAAYAFAMKNLPAGALKKEATGFARFHEGMDAAALPKKGKQARAALTDAVKSLPDGAMKTEANASLQLLTGRAAATVAGRDAEALAAFTEAARDLSAGVLKVEADASLQFLAGRAAAAAGTVPAAKAAFTAALPGLPDGPLKAEAEAYNSSH